MKMTIDICKSIFRTLASEGVIFSDGFFKSLSVAYLRQAEDTIMKYEADAAINGLEFDRHEEAKAVEAFTVAIAGRRRSSWRIRWARRSSRTGTG